jgi:AcrR family transcriptional regulator
MRKNITPARTPAARSTAAKTPASKPKKRSSVVPAKISAHPLSLPEALELMPQPAGRREQILHAAVEVLNADGFGGLTQTRVAECAGIRQSHLTYYFPARNDLLRETAVYGCQAMLGALELGIESGELNLANFREVLAVDIHDRRFARLMCALIVSSDEDAAIKPWLASFEAANFEQLKRSFHKLGLPVTLEEVAFFHATYVGSVMIDLGESTADSLARAQGNVMMAFDTIAGAARLRADALVNTRTNARAKKTSMKPVAATKGKKK